MFFPPVCFLYQEKLEMLLLSQVSVFVVCFLCYWRSQMHIVSHVWRWKLHLVTMGIIVQITKDICGFFLKFVSILRIFSKSLVWIKKQFRFPLSSRMFYHFNNILWVNFYWNKTTQFSKHDDGRNERTGGKTMSLVMPIWTHSCLALHEDWSKLGWLFIYSLVTENSLIVLAVLINLYPWVCVNRLDN